MLSKLRHSLGPSLNTEAQSVKPRRSIYSLKTRRNGRPQNSQRKCTLFVLLLSNKAHVSYEELQLPLRASNPRLNPNQPLLQYLALSTVLTTTSSECYTTSSHAPSQPVVVHTRVLQIGQGFYICLGACLFTAKENG